jgi:hypothetical protein
MEAPENLHGQGNGFGRQESAAEYGFAEPRDFTVFMNFYQAVGDEAGYFQPDRI